ncbi:ribulose-phosphate 3-epimerase [Caminibacter pacificus]|uniref:Ribulose-phosphate 3-epimerase n=1 Tax=Caminibacter pacificus TaxID=1424653 RepID=A0AAJ4UY63_9BACT|nr:ribulose-phosphate 3-epimerase [Caminibacter pacificus]QCI27668.1 ribulose-phosphate 3-epimerase [Caminibacter pacificus]ROR40157.1 ribulose-phosphate 3-epimerase [Caminibacter pacificus]
MKIAPSILSADFGKLADEVKAVCDGGADLIHVDVMDGHFVPNMTMGPMIVEAVAKVSTKPLDIHFMVENIPFFVDMYKHLNPEFISFHIEEEKHINRVIQKIRNEGIRPAVVLNPATPVCLLEYIVSDVDMVLLMSVNPGFGGQKFIPSVIDKIKELRELAEKKNPNLLIEVDGGVNNKNAPLLKEAGADILVAGSYVFKSGDYKKAIESLRV